MTFTRRSFVTAALALPGCAREARPASSPPRVDVLARGLNHPWSLAFLPDGALLVSEKFAGLRRLEAGVLHELPGAPSNILAQGDSGLLDIALDPDFTANRTLYLTFTAGTPQANRMAIYRARYDEAGLRDGEEIFRAARTKQGDGHSGGRMAFLADGTFIVTTGEGYDYRDEAQNLRSHLGKTLRLTRTGLAPANNPFVGRADALPEIYTWGHRNPLGLARDGDALWLAEMGPRGGDEINRLVPGANYGWPKTTYGTDYDGTMITPLQEAPGVTNPTVVFNPSISPSGLTIYQGDAFPDWRGDLLVGALSGQHLRRVRIRDGQAVLEEVLLYDRHQRIRDVRVGADGLIYLLTDSDAGEIWRLSPA